MTHDEESLARLQAVLTALLKLKLDESLGEVDAAMSRWRSGELGPFETHAEVLRHAARAERLAGRIARVTPDGAGTVLRDAYDVGLLTDEEFVDLVGCPPDQVEPSPELDPGEVPDLPAKQTFITEILEEGPVLLHVDARRDGVSVPDRLKVDPRLVLRFGHGLAPAITDLTLNDDEISGTLTFGGVPFHCTLPWPAVYAAVSEVSQQAMVWPDDVPLEVLDEMARREGDTPPLRSVPESEAVEAKRSAKRGRPHLKLVE